MQFVSSDTNVWIDFSTINRIELPFRLPYRYIMNTDAINDELCSPTGLKEQLLSCGLHPVDITIEEFELAEMYGASYLKLSTYDRIALAIAKSRNIVLLTGDGALRKAAIAEGVALIGTLGILDQLHNDGSIDDKEYRYCLSSFQRFNGGKIRLPKDAIAQRLKKLDIG